MIVEAQVSIDGSKEAVWNVITDFENLSKIVSGIDQVEVLEKPKFGLVGLKWRETRTFFGKTATEEMWITDVSEHQCYNARAESNGFRYRSKISVAEENGQCFLTMTHDSQPQSFVAKCLSPIAFLFRTAMKSAFLRDLNDIKAAVEQNNTNSGETGNSRRSFAFPVECLTNWHASHFHERKSKRPISPSGRKAKLLSTTTTCDIVTAIFISGAAIWQLPYKSF